MFWLLQSLKKSKSKYKTNAKRYVSDAIAAAFFRVGIIRRQWTYKSRPWAMYGTVTNVTSHWMYRAAC